MTTLPDNYQNEQQQVKTMVIPGDNTLGIRGFLGYMVWRKRWRLKDFEAWDSMYKDYRECRLKAVTLTLRFMHKINTNLTGQGTINTKVGPTKNTTPLICISKRYLAENYEKPFDLTLYNGAQNIPEGINLANADYVYDFQDNTTGNDFDTQIWTQTMNSTTAENMHINTMQFMAIIRNDQRNYRYRIKPGKTYKITSYSRPEFKSALAEASANDAVVRGTAAPWLSTDDVNADDKFWHYGLQIAILGSQGMYLPCLLESQMSVQWRGLRINKTIDTAPETILERVYTTNTNTA